MIESGQWLVYDAAMTSQALIHKALVVRPPMVCPVMPGFLSNAVYSILKELRIEAGFYDAGIDFYLSRILKDINPLDREGPGEIFSTDLFYSPEKYLLVKDKLDHVLLTISNAVFPCRIRWNGFKTGNDLRLPKLTNNPFSTLCQKNLRERIEAFHPEKIFFCLSTMDQWLAVLTMVAFGRSQYPEIQSVVISKVEDNPGLIGTGNGFEMKQVTPDTLVDLLRQSTGLQTGSGRISPGSLPSPLPGYLSPGLILPVDAAFITAPSQMNEYLSGIQNVKDICGIVIENPGCWFDLSGHPAGQFFFSLKDADRENGVSIDRDVPLGALAEQGLRMIVWDAERMGASELSPVLWKLSKQGIWNHINVPENTPDDLKEEWCRFIASNPNIAHSYTVPDSDISYETPSSNRIDPVFDSYSAIPPVPGIPFWQVLEHPAHIMLYLERFSKQGLFCMRAKDDHSSSYYIGRDIQYFYKKPTALSARRFEEICSMVEAGGSVDPTYVRHNLKRAFLIAYATEHGVIVGNSSLKHPRDVFVKRINKISGFDFTHFVERGYTSVRPEYRALGVGARLLAGLTRRSGDRKVFSIISEDNTATQKIALKNNTRKIVTYHSEKMGKDVGIWMPEHMIEDHWDILP